MLVAQQVRDEFERVTRAGQVVVDAAHHERAAMAALQCQHLLAVEPAGAQDAVVQRPGRIVPAEAAAEGDSQEGPGRVRRLPQVDADDLARHERPAGLLQRLARDGVLQGLAVVEVTRGLVQHHAAAGAFLDEQEMTVALDDGGHGDVGFPDHGLHYSGVDRAITAIWQRSRAWHARDSS